MGAGASREADELLDAARRGDSNSIVRALTKPDGKVAPPPPVRGGAVARLLLGREGLLHVAARHGQSEVLRAVLTPLVEAARKEVCARRPPRAGGAAAAAAEAAAAPALRALCDAVNVRDGCGRTPLHLAAKEGHVDSIKVLLASYADASAVDFAGCTCLHAAARKGHAAAVAAILLHGASGSADAAAWRLRLVNRRNVSGFTALSYAAWAGCEGSARLLLRSGAEISTTNLFAFDPSVPVALGSSPLHLAAIQGNLDVAVAILEQYALQCIGTPPSRRPPPDPRRAPNLHGATPADAAVGGGRRLAELLDPRAPLARVVDIAALTSERGPLRLAAIAAGAWRARLLSLLDDLERRECDDAAAARRFAGDSCADISGHAAAAAAGGQAVAAVDGAAKGQLCGGAGAAAPPAPAGETADDDDGEAGGGACGICFEELVPQVALRGCGHRLCLDCARGIAGHAAAGAKPATPTCPFCRGAITGFERAGVP